MLAVVVCLGAGLGSAVAQAPAPVPGPPPTGADSDHLIVRLEEPRSREEQKKVADRVGGRRIRELRPGVFTVAVAKGRGRDAARRLAADADVARAEPDVRFEAVEIPNEPCFSGCLLSFDGGTTSERFSQEHMVQVGAPDAWSITKGSPDTLVAVIDTDVDPLQPDLAGKVVMGRNFSGDVAPDPEGHGTAVAGIIAAQPNNGMGIAGLGWNTKVLAVRVLDSTGSGLASEIAAGVRYAADYPGVKVINLSLQQDAASADQVSTELAEAIEYAQDRDVLVVAAAGNQPESTPSYPAHFPGVLSVAAVDRDDDIAYFSRRGTWVDIAAPGVAVLTVAPGCDCWASPDGTSFAAPFVAAAAALVATEHPFLSAEEVADRLTSTADPVEGTGQDFSHGRLNVARAVSAMEDPTPDPDADPSDEPGPKRVPTTPTVSGVDPSESAPPVDVPAPGYWLVGSDGGVFSYGSSEFHGSTGALALNKPIVGMADTPSGGGYWTVASDGGIFAFGDAAFFGSTGALALNKPIVGMAATRTGRGYWLVASDGGIFAFGDAVFHGSTGAVALNQPIVGMAATPSGAGYWLVASDGGIFGFGDAAFFGSTGAFQLAQPIVGMAATPSGGGYWLVASDGGIFAFGDARFFGAGAGLANVVGMAANRAGDGYWVVAADGRVVAFGAAAGLGSVEAAPLNHPIVGFTAR